MMPPGTENGESHSDINIPPIMAAHIGVSNVNDAEVVRASQISFVNSETAVMITDINLNTFIIFSYYMIDLDYLSDNPIFSGVPLSIQKCCVKY